MYPAPSLHAYCFILSSPLLSTRLSTPLYSSPLLSTPLQQPILQSMVHFLSSHFHSIIFSYCNKRPFSSGKCMDLAAGMSKELGNVPEAAGAPFLSFFSLLSCHFSSVTSLRSLSPLSGVYADAFFCRLLTKSLPLLP